MKADEIVDHISPEHLAILWRCYASISRTAKPKSESKLIENQITADVLERCADDLERSLSNKM